MPRIRQQPLCVTLFFPEAGAFQHFTKKQKKMFVHTLLTISQPMADSYFAINIQSDSANTFEAQRRLDNTVMSIKK